MAHPIERLRAKHEEFQQRMVWPLACALQKVLVPPYRLIGTVMICKKLEQLSRTKPYLKGVPCREAGHCAMRRRGLMPCAIRMTSHQLSQRRTRSSMR